MSQYTSYKPTEYAELADVRAVIWHSISAQQCIEDDRLRDAEKARELAQMYVNKLRGTK